MATREVESTAAVVASSKRVKGVELHSEGEPKKSCLGVMGSTNVEAIATVDASSKRATSVAPSVVVARAGVVPTELTASCRELPRWFPGDLKQSPARRCCRELTRSRCSVS